MASPVFVSSRFTADGLSSLQNLNRKLNAAIPDLHRFGANRAKKAFHSRSHTITKPSYISRIEHFSAEWPKHQLDSIEEIFSREPFSGGLVFSVFHPRDLVDRMRPGYVPCLVSGSVVLAHGKLHLNAFFRSQSTIEFGVYDLIFLRELQLKLRDRFRSLKPRHRIEVGALNILFGRVIIQRRLARRRIKMPNGRIRHVELKRDAVIPAWLRVVREHLAQLPVEASSKTEEIPTAWEDLGLKRYA